MVAPMRSMLGSRVSGRSNWRPESGRRQCSNPNNLFTKYGSFSGGRSSFAAYIQRCVPLLLQPITPRSSGFSPPTSPRQPARPGSPPVASQRRRTQPPRQRPRHLSLFGSRVPGRVLLRMSLWLPPCFPDRRPLSRATARCHDRQAVANTGDWEGARREQEMEALNRRARRG
jgi:hypothetical protein